MCQFDCFPLLECSLCLEITCTADPLLNVLPNLSSLSKTNITRGISPEKGHEKAQHSPDSRCEGIARLNLNKA